MKSTAARSKVCKVAAAPVTISHHEAAIEELLIIASVFGIRGDQFFQDPAGRRGEAAAQPGTREIITGLRDGLRDSPAGILGGRRDVAEIHQLA